jgi:hypothetical protein
MNKKNFRTSFDDLLAGDPSTPKAQEAKQVQRETKATFVVRYDQLDKLKAISYMERKMIKNVLEEALSLYIQKYEREGGEILLPKK